MYLPPHRSRLRLALRHLVFVSARLGTTWFVCLSVQEPTEQMSQMGDRDWPPDLVSDGGKGLLS